MSFEPLFSMPHGRNIFFPFFLTAISLVLSFRTLSSCDLITTKWSIDCSSAYSSQCVLKSDLNLGLLGRETFVNINVESGVQPNLEDLTKVCRWYSVDEREWLLGKPWDIAIISQTSIVSIALIGFILIGITSCYAFGRIILFKMLAVIFGFCAVLNCYPLFLRLKSDFCTIDEGICNPSMSSCVSTCSWGSGSWQVMASSCLWVSTAFTTWLISPAHKGKYLRKDDLSSSETDDSGYDDDIENAK